MPCRTEYPRDIDDRLQSRNIDQRTDRPFTAIGIQRSKQARIRLLQALRHFDRRDHIG